MKTLILLITLLVIGCSQTVSLSVEQGEVMDAGVEEAMSQQTY